MKTDLKFATKRLYFFLSGHLKKIATERKKRTLHVFCWHDISDQPQLFEKKYGLNVSRKIFEKQIKIIEKNFEIIRLKDINHALEDGSAGARYALITFDDGYRGAIEHGASLLASKGIESIHFLNGASVFQSEPMISALSINQLGLGAHLSITPREADQIISESKRSSSLKTIHNSLADKEFIDSIVNEFIYFGSHGHRHYNATALTSDEFIKDIVLNSSQLKAAFPENYLPMHAFANGQPGTCFQQSHVDLTRQLGFERVFSSAGGYMRKSSYLIDRIALSFESTKQELMYRSLHHRAK